MLHCAGYHTSFRVVIVSFKSHSFLQMSTGDCTAHSAVAVAAAASVVASELSPKGLAMLLFGLQQWHSWLCAQRRPSSTPSPISHTYAQTSPINRSPHHLHCFNVGQRGSYVHSSADDSDRSPCTH